MNDALKRAISKQTGASEKEVETLFDRAFNFEYLQRMSYFMDVCKVKGIQRRRRGLNMPQRRSPHYW